MSDSNQGAMYKKVLLLMMRSKRHLARAVEHYDMTVAQGMMLMLLEPRRGTPMQELSCMMGCDASNITGLVERLDAIKMINQTIDPNDRRVKRIELSTKGAAARKFILEHLQAADALDLQKLSDDEQTTLVKFINKITSINR